MADTDNTTNMPMSLRRYDSEQQYYAAKQSDKLIPLTDEPSLHEWNHWTLKDNRFPYDIAFVKHHMLIPKNPPTGRFGLTDEQRDELELILEYFVYPNYDLWFENTPKRRSVPGIYHLHLASYYDSREKMGL